MSSQKNTSLKKLSIREVYQLYRLLEDGIPVQDEKYLMDEILKILNGVSTHAFKQAMQVLYGEEFYVNKDSGQIALMFVRGIKQSNFLPFVQIMKDLRGNS